MAFEIARVHQLICSRVGDDVLYKTSRNESASVESDPASSLTCSPVRRQLHAHYPSDFSCSYPGFELGCDTSNLPSDLSSVSVETESEEDDDLLQSLAQQIAHSLLDEESNAVTCSGISGRGGCAGARDLSIVEANEGRLSPPSCPSGSWSSGSLLSGSRSSSKGSSTVSSQVSSPSSAPSSGYQDAWDTLYAAAGEVVRLKMNEEKKVSVYANERPSHSNSLNPILRAQPQQARLSGQMVGKRSPQSIRRKDENLVSMNQQAHQNWASNYVAMNAMTGQAQPHCNRYQQHQQAYAVDGQQGVNTFYHPEKSAESKITQRNRHGVLNAGSGVRVVFLGGSSGRESGTGVFLPRSFEPKKKVDPSSLNAPLHGCSTGARHARNPKEGVWPTLQQSMNQSTIRQSAVGHEPCLPTEWTY